MAEGNPSLPPSHIKIKEEEPEMSSSGDHKFAEPAQEAKVNFVDSSEQKSETLRGDDHEVGRVRRQAQGKLVDGKSLYGLPEGWVVEQRPRTSHKYLGKIDQFFYEPNTKKQFRSLKSAQKWIEETTTDQLKPAHEAFQASDGSKAPQRSKPRLSSTRKKKETQAFDFANPPEKTTWLLTEAENDEWSPCIGDTMVPDQVKNYWAETCLKASFGNV